jgi:ABC-type nitrate/sulfonate/bicarbonate transport system substrate-binding protein
LGELKYINQEKRYKVNTIKLFIFLCTVTALLTTNLCAKEIKKEIVLGCEISFLTSSILVAENKEYFKEKGLNIKTKEFDSGRNALAAMLKNRDIDICTVAQTPIVLHSFHRDDFAIIGAMVSSYNDIKVLVRQDKGIKKPMDLRGKKVGVTKGSTGHFYLNNFLDYNGLTDSDVDGIDLNASELPQALADGRVDAISTWEPHIVNAMKILGEKALFLPGESIFREDFYFVVLKSFIKDNPESLKMFLGAIEKGENFIHENKEEAITIVSERLKIDKETTATVWEDFDFQLILDQSIFTSLEVEARWAIREGMTEKREVPNYLDFIYIDALEDVNPESVTIIR